MRTNLTIVAAIVVIAMFVPSGIFAGIPFRKIHAKDIPSIVAGDSGKVVLVNLWATWCGECREEMPALLKLREEMPERGFVLELFSADDAEDSLKAAKYLDSLGVKFQTYLKADINDDELIAGLDSTWSGALPTSLLFDRRGKMVEQIVGAKKYDFFKKRIDGLLARKN